MILDESPELSFEEARQLARTQLLKAAGKKNYRVTTPKEDRQTVERFRRRVNPTWELPRTAILARSLDGSETDSSLPRHPHARAARSALASQGVMGLREVTRPRGNHGNALPVLRCGRYLRF